MCRLIISLLLLLNAVLSKNVTSFCGDKILYGTRGTIKTNPKPFTESTACLWMIYPPPNTITTIRILNSNLEQCAVKNACCLSVFTNSSLRRKYIELCNDKLVRPTTLSVPEGKIFIDLRSHITWTPNIWIEYFTRARDECPHSNFQCYDKTGCYNRTDKCTGNFICNDHSDKIDCGQCKVNFAPCDDKLDNCFDPISQRCDVSIQCPNGEDEMGCTKLCAGSIQCRNESTCITPEKLCDKNVDCIDGFDEEHCVFEKQLPTSSIGMLVFVISTLCSTLFLCLIFHWIPSRRNTQRLFLGIPEFPEDPFQGPREEDRESASSGMFSDSEFIQGGEIYESYLQSIKNYRKAQATKSVQTNVCEKISYSKMDAENELIVLASLNISHDMCVGLTIPDTSFSLLLSDSNTSSDLKILKTLSRGDLKRESTSQITQGTNNLHDSVVASEHCLENKNKSLVKDTTSNSSEWTDVDDTETNTVTVISEALRRKAPKQTRKRKYIRYKIPVTKQN